MNALKDFESFTGVNRWTKKQLWAYQGYSQDFAPDTDNYYAMYAIETYGSELRDNSLAELIAIGKRIEREEEIENEKI